MSNNKKVLKFPKKKKRFHLSEKEKRIFVICFSIFAFVVFILIEALKSKYGF